MSSRLISLSGWRPSRVTRSLELEPVTGLRSGPHDEHADLGGQFADGHDHVVVVARRVLQRVDDGERDGAIVERVER